MKPANSFEPLPTSRLIRVPSLLALCFLSGCATNSAVLRVNQPDRSLVVVPVKGQPIMVRSLHTTTFVLGGIIGGQIEQAMATGSSESLCARLNQYTNFNGERILAEESAKLLKTSPKSSFRDVTVRPFDGAMPDTRNMEPSEQRQFKVNCPNLSRWSDNFYAWKASPSVSNERIGNGRRVVFLEVTFFSLWLNHQDRIEALIFMRVTDPENGEMPGFAGLSENYDISAVTTSSDLRSFEADFRKIMNEAASKLLRDLNLL